MTKEEFRLRWDGDEDGGGITYDDIADCYVAWGLGSYPKTKELETVTYAVLKAANTQDAERRNPNKEFL